MTNKPQDSAECDSDKTTSNDKQKNKVRKRVIFGLIYAVGIATIIYGVSGLFGTVGEELAARSEYDALREIAFEITYAFEEIENDSYGEPEVEEIENESANCSDDEVEPEVDDSAESEEPFLTQLFLTQLYELNPDFVGWIEIPGTAVNYPVVRGDDNSFYLKTTFLGEPNRAGSIFMDFRARRDFGTPVTILYGHNMRDGSMFSALMKYTSRTFLEDNSEIRIITADGEMYFYDIVSARRTDAWDEVYQLNFDHADKAQSFFDNYYSEHFLVLSTCWRGADRDPDDRFIVAAVRRP